MSYTVYILQCCDKSLYTGIAQDLEKRINEHEAGKGSKYVRSRLPVTVVHTETAPSKSEALKREHEIKQMTKVEKLVLVGD